MRSGALVGALALAVAACAAPRPAAPPPAMAQTPPPPPPAPANIVVIASEAVERPEVDSLSKVRVFVDGKEVGETSPGLSSETKRWEGRVPAGNQPVRFERWVMRRISDWTLEASIPERFVRIDETRSTTLTLRFFEDGRRYEVTRSP
ncbi:MAG: hypothetical protein HY078_13215 [Elusimicrobia bacterium]|nr:hypothetical protein [Elusimicrobiota bacterium]